jgi:hypothetical protein
MNKQVTFRQSEGRQVSHCNVSLGSIQPEVGVVLAAWNAYMHKGERGHLEE